MTFHNSLKFQDFPRTCKNYVEIRIFMINLTFSTWFDIITLEKKNMAAEC